jgi:ABC-2 type transport system permease protein
VTSEVRALATSTWIEVKLFLREPLTVIFTLALPLLFLFVLGGVFGNTPTPGYYRGAGPLDFYVPGYVSLVWAAVGLLAMPVHVARYREDGVLRRLQASSAPPWTVLGAQIAVALLIALVGGVLVVAAAALTYDIHFPSSVAGFVGAWLLCGVLFASLGLLLSSIPSSRGALGAGLGLFFVMMLLSGTAPPPEVLTGAMHWVSNALPLTYMLRLLQDPWLGLPWSTADTVVVLAFAAGGIITSRLTFRWE